MNAELFDLGQRMAARDLGHAVARLDHAQAALTPHACLIAVLALSGDHVGLWGVAVGAPADAGPHVKIAGDPRRRSQQAEIWRFLSDRLRHYVAWCEVNSRAPQLITATPACRDQLVACARRFAWSDDPALADAAATVVVLAERVGMPGQQAFLDLHSVLSTHAVTGAEPWQDNTLSGLLRWHQQGAPAAPRMLPGAQVQQSPGGDIDDDCTTPSHLDLEASPLARRLRQLETVDDTRSVAVIHGQLATLLEPTLQARWRRLRAAGQALHALALPPLPELRAFEVADFKHWTRWQHRRSEGKHPLRSSPRAAFLTLTAAEEAQERLTAAALRRDDIAFLRATFAGTAVDAHVTGCDTGSVTIDVSGPVRLRGGARLEARSDAGWVFSVQDLIATTDGSRIHLRICAAGEEPQPHLGQRLQLIGATTTLSRVAIVQRHTARDTLPWTHQPSGPRDSRLPGPGQHATAAPRRAAREAPADLLALAARLRTPPQRPG